MEAKRLVIELEWQGPGGGAEFIVERRQGQRRFEAIATVNQRRYRDEAVDLGERYDYQVRTVLADDVPSGPSNQVTINLAPGALVKPPSGLQATIKALGQGDAGGGR
jgi:fibronectin type 3 domain-containing protein